MSKHKNKKEVLVFNTKDIKVRKRFAPGVRVFKSDKDKEHKHKPDYLSDLEV